MKKQSVGVILGGLLALVAGVLGLTLVVSISVPSAVVAAITNDKQSGNVKVTPPSDVPGIDPVLMDAFNKAVAKTSKTCKGMRWQVLAGVGQIESHLAQGVTIAKNGDTKPHIVGIPVGADHDHGRWDGDKSQDHAVGVLQIIPTSWDVYGADGNGDGSKDPNNVYDNALGSAKHLCGTAKGIDLGTDAGLSKALFAYNQSDTYVSQVSAAIQAFDTQYANDGGGGAEFTSTCSVDKNLPRKNPHTCSQAIATAKAMTKQSCVWFELCLGFTARAYGWHGSGIYSAYEQYQLLDSLGDIHTDRNPPPGALVFWKGSGIYGHIAIAVGGGKIASNDIVRNGCIDIVDWDTPETQWGQRYLGWAPPYYPKAD